MAADRSALDELAQALGERVRRDEPMSRYTAMRVGGPADLLIVCEQADGVVRAAKLAGEHCVDWRVLGGGCNVLVADAGIRGLVIVNKAAQIVFDGSLVHADAGAMLAQVSKEAVARGLAGLEWAAGLPGAVGGAVVGNAGAFEGNIAGVLQSSTVLDPDGTVVEQPNVWFEFSYRLSRIKRDVRQGRRPVVLAATFALQPGDPRVSATRADEILEWRRTRHPSGATMGSTFKNPPGSHAGYLIEQAGLQGTRIGGAEISMMHGNFFMNTGTATAADVAALIEHARAVVKQQFGIEMDLEIEFVGAWEAGREA